MGTSSVLLGIAPGITAQQEAGTETTVFFPMALSTYLMDRVAPQPWHAVFPGSINSCFGIEKGTSVTSTDIYPVSAWFLVLHNLEHFLKILNFYIPSAQPGRESIDWRITLPIKGA